MYKNKLLRMLERQYRTFVLHVTNFGSNLDIADDCPQYLYGYLYCTEPGLTPEHSQEKKIMINIWPFILSAT